jgi:hypothetical protein
LWKRSKWQRAAGLLLRSFRTLMGVNPGFQTDRVIAMNISLPQLRYADGIATGIVPGFPQRLLFQVKTDDWRAYAGPVALLSVVAVVAALTPARRGARVDPVVELRQE